MKTSTAIALGPALAYTTVGVGRLARLFADAGTLPAHDIGYDERFFCPSCDVVPFQPAA